MTERRRHRAACRDCGCAVDFDSMLCYRCGDKIAFKTPGPDPTDLGRRADAILREKPGEPPIVVGDPKTGAAFAMSPDPYTHGVYRRHA